MISSVRFLLGLFWISCEAIIKNPCQSVFEPLADTRLHEEGGYEGGDDRQDEVADLVERDVFEQFHFELGLELNNCSFLDINLRKSGHKSLVKKKILAKILNKIYVRERAGMSRWLSRP